MNQSLFERLEEVKARLVAAPAVLLFLGFDGVLAPFVDVPEKAELSPVARKSLQALSRRKNVVTTVLSGRELADLQPRVGLPDAIYAGNHGLEISGPGFTFVEPTAAGMRDTLRALAETLVGILKRIPGAEVEDKGLTLSVHCRRVGEADREEVRRLVHGVMANASHPWALTQGDLVYEIQPRVYWNKGAAVNWIRERLGKEGAAAVYLGDDATDEDAFAVLRDDVTVKVGGAGESAAHYRVGGQAEAERFLAWLASLLT
jgi:trehalose 6-phosphate phosphatase